MSFLLLAFGAILGILLLVLAAELSARFFFRHVLRPYVHVPHTHLKWHLNPDAFPALQQRDITYRVNSEGERGDEPPPGKDYFRVLVLGGSAAECGLLDQDKTWSAQLQTILNRPESLRLLGYSRAHVGLVARSEFDSTAVCQILQAIHPAYHNLGALVIMTGFADFLRWLGAGAPDNNLPPQIPNHRVFFNHPTIRYSLKRPALKQLHKYFTIAVRRKPTYHSSVGNHNAVERVERAHVQEFTKLTSDPSHVWIRYRQNLTWIINFVKKHNYRLIFARQPWFEKPHYTPDEEAHLWEGRIGKRGDGSPRRFLSHADFFALCRHSDSITTEVADQFGIEHIDLQSILPLRVGVYSDHIHFAEEGAQLVAQIIADRILSRNNP